MTIANVSSMTETAHRESMLTEALCSPLAPALPPSEVSTLADRIANTSSVLLRDVEAATTAIAHPKQQHTAELAAAVTNAGLLVESMLIGYAKAITVNSELPKSLGYRHATDLLQHELGLRARRAQDAVAIGHLLHDRRYPAVADAVEDAVISLDQAISITRAIDKLAVGEPPEHVQIAQERIVDFATGTDSMLPLKPETLSQMIRGWFYELNPASVEIDHADQQSLRSCSYARLENGMVDIRAVVPADEGAKIITLLDAYANPRVGFRDAEDAEAHAGDQAADIDDPRTRRQKMADGLVRAFDIAAKAAKVPSQGGSAPVLTVTIPVVELDKHAEGAPAVARVDRTREIVPAGVAARIACDGIIQSAVTGNDGETLYLGRSQRLFSPKQKTALALTYPTCAVGDCDIPAAWCEAHHARPWSQGGLTDQDQGVLVCNYHHHQIHQGHLEVQRRPGSKRFDIRRTIASARRQRTRAA